MLKHRPLSWSLSCLVICALAAGCDPPPEQYAAQGPKQILFGDLHVHSTYSTDALIYSAPLLDGKGATPPELHCDYARFCSQVDFWSINDHPEGVLPELWEKTKKAVRTCNQLEGGDTMDPQMVSFLGWEWTQNADTPAAAWGHKNVIFRDTAENRVPRRPIGAPASVLLIEPSLIKMGIGILQAVDTEHSAVYTQLGKQIMDGVASPVCAAGVDTRELPAGCRKVAKDPAALFEKLSQWGYPAMVIPHGTTWGAHNPALSSWSYQLNRRQHSPEYQRLVELYSGHGNSEEYRAWRGVEKGAGGELTCPKPSKGYLPCCWQAGEITRKQGKICKAGPNTTACEAEVAAARKNFIKQTPLKKFVSVGSSQLYRPAAGEWLDCGQCTDCFQPAYLFRPNYSVQAALAMTSFEKPDNPLRFKWGIIGSTDAHRAGPGAGYKEQRRMSDSFGPAEAKFDVAFNAVASMVFPEWERQGSYLYAGALVAVHSRGRSRGAIWDAMGRREVYATSGERILLWFDLLNGPGGEPVHMGGEARLTAAPRFQVRAVGAFKQKPGCPERSLARAPAGFITKYCHGECYNPSDQRYLITKVDVIKIEPQTSAGEDLSRLVQDPYRTFTCKPDAAGCKISFTDEAYVTRGRPAVYYVRVYQEPTLQFNAGTLRGEKDAAGKCVKIKPCPTGFRGINDDCRVKDAERAWSSPIYLDH